MYVHTFVSGVGCIVWSCPMIKSTTSLMHAHLSLAVRMTEECKGLTRWLGIVDEVSDCSSISINPVWLKPCSFSSNQSKPSFVIWTWTTCISSVATEWYVGGSVPEACVEWWECCNCLRVCIDVVVACPSMRISSLTTTNGIPSWDESPWLNTMTFVHVYYFQL